MYQPSLDALAAGGHKGRWFKTPAEYWAAADPANLDVLVAIGALKVGADFLDQAPNLRALISPVTGTEGFDEAAASARNVLVANGQILENYVSMAEATVMLILAALYDLNGTQRLLAENGPRPPRPRAHVDAKDSRLDRLRPDRAGGCRAAGILGLPHSDNDAHGARAA